ncbi:hypothetical protein, partial [Pseudomonas aeruginosa]|uniref:hypothetical protein n=1 Tax=Pseudomonas aeruginosa TaxID=287 RepID=UPI003F822CCF
GVGGVALGCLAVVVYCAWQVCRERLPAVPRRAWGYLLGGFVCWVGLLIIMVADGGAGPLCGLLGVLLLGVCLSLGVLY